MAILVDTNSTYYKELYKKDTSPLHGQPSITEEVASIMSGTGVNGATNTAQTASGEKCTDGNDDGKIGFFSKVGNFFKGIGKTIVNGVKNLCTPKGLLKAAAITAACIIGGPVVTAGVLAVGAIKGAATVVKGAKAAHNATTDEEAKMAWQNIGGGTFQVAASVAPMKGVCTAIKAQGGIVASLKASTAGQAAAAVKSSIKTNGVKGTLSNGYQAAKSGIKAAPDAIKNATKTAKENASLKYENLKGQYELSRATGKNVFESAKDAANLTNAGKAYNLSRNSNGRLKAAGDVVKNSSPYTKAVKLGVTATTTKATIANLLEAAYSDDEMAAVAAKAKLEELGYNVY